MALVMRGTATVEGSNLSDEIMEISVSKSTDSVAISATLGLESSFEAGNSTYQATIRFHQGVAATNLSQLAWNNDELDISMTLKPGAAATDNPEYSMTAIVTDATLGGRVNEELVDSVTWPLKARPTENRGA